MELKLTSTQNTRELRSQKPTLQCYAVDTHQTRQDHPHTRTTLRAPPRVHYQSARAHSLLLENRSRSIRFEAASAFDWIPLVAGRRSGKRSDRCGCVHCDEQSLGSTFMMARLPMFCFIVLEKNTCLKIYF